MASPHCLYMSVLRRAVSLSFLPLVLSLAGSAGHAANAKDGKVSSMSASSYQIHVKGYSNANRNHLFGITIDLRFLLIIITTCWRIPQGDTTHKQRN